MRDLRVLCRRLARNGKGFYAVLRFRDTREYRIYHSHFRDMRFSTLVCEATSIAECQQFLIDELC